MFRVRKIGAYASIDRSCPEDIIKQNFNSLFKCKNKF